MNSKAKRAGSAFALLLVFCVSQIFVGAGVVATESQTPTQVANSAGILTTIGSKPVKVNGAEAITGTTILSGAEIQTREGVGANVSLAQLGSLEMEPNAKVTLTFQSGAIKVLLLKGCVTLNARKGVTGEIETSKDAINKTDPTADGVLRVCHPDSAQLASAAAARGGSGKLAKLTIIGVPSALLIPGVTPGSNPSNSNPR